MTKVEHFIVEKPDGESEAMEEKTSVVEMKPITPRASQTNTPRESQTEIKPGTIF